MKTVERGRCWTCKWEWQSRDEDGLKDSGCDNHNIPEEFEEPEVMGYDLTQPQCRWWEEKVKTAYIGKETR